MQGFPKSTAKSTEILADISECVMVFELDDRIVRIAVSHNQDINWLQRQISALDCDPDAEHQADLGEIHWTWIGWLLRLADVLDCDASRTPRILFGHAGITDARSGTEWRKHLAIPRPPTWSENPSGATQLTYTCPRCPDPEVEKALRQIQSWMNDEIGKCRTAWEAVAPAKRKGLKLDLPDAARIDIKQRLGGYIYQDIEFRIDHDAVVELVMGESLYDSPELALRELVQNALDAVHLRDQRNCLAHALEKLHSTERSRQPYEPWGATTGEVRVSWGTTDDGRSWIKVQDNGVGMTIGAMRQFLTQIGRGYYKSDEFHAEQELMRRHGILCTAISQFGIGFLSVFMLADHVEICTRPVGGKDQPPPRDRQDLMQAERFPFRAVIHGLNGLVAFFPDESIRLPGTTVTAWLKPRYVLGAVDRELLLARIRTELYGMEMPTKLRKVLADRAAFTPDKTPIEPAIAIARFVLWPLYPVHLGSPGEETTRPRTRGISNCRINKQTY